MKDSRRISVKRISGGCKATIFSLMDEVQEAWDSEEDKGALSQRTMGAHNILLTLLNDLGLVEEYERWCKK